MGGQGQRRKRKCTLGYTPWPSRIRTWFSSMFDPPKEVRILSSYLSFRIVGIVNTMPKKVFDISL